MFQRLCIGMVDRVRHGISNFGCQEHRVFHIYHNVIVVSYTQTWARQRHTISIKFIQPVSFDLVFANMLSLVIVSNRLTNMPVLFTLYVANKNATHRQPRMSSKKKKKTDRRNGGLLQSTLWQLFAFRLKNLTGWRHSPLVSIIMLYKLHAIKMNQIVHWMERTSVYTNIITTSIVHCHWPLPKITIWMA